MEARLDFDEDLPPLDDDALAARIAAQAATIQVLSCSILVPPQCLKFAGRLEVPDFETVHCNFCSELSFEAPSITGSLTLLLALMLSGLVVG